MELEHHSDCKNIKIKLTLQYFLALFFGGKQKMAKKRQIKQRDSIKIY